MCDALLVAETIDSYQAALKNLNKFVKDKEDREFLEPWLKWWDDRREFIFRAFTPSHAPNMNQAEVVHASWANRNRSNLSMLEAAHADTRDSVLLEAQLKQYREGVSSGGTGPSFAQRNYRRELDQAERYGREINKIGIGNTVDGNSGHRPPERHEKKKGKGKTTQTRKTTSSENSSTQSTQFSFSEHFRSAHTQPRSRFGVDNSIIQSRLGIANVNNNNSSLRPMFAQPPDGTSMQYHLPPTSMLPTSIWHSGMLPNPYEIVLLPSNVRKCYGCGHDFVDKYRQHPYNIVVKHKDIRIMWKDSLTGVFIYSTDFNNTYYHPHPEHIKRKNPLFIGLVRLPKNLYKTLNTMQRQVLESTGLNIQIVS